MFEQSVPVAAYAVPGTTPEQVKRLTYDKPNKPAIMSVRLDTVKC